MHQLLSPWQLYPWSLLVLLFVFLLIQCLFAAMLLDGEKARMSLVVKMILWLIKHVEVAIYEVYSNMSVSCGTWIRLLEEQTGIFLIREQYKFYNLFSFLRLRVRSHGVFSDSGSRSEWLLPTARKGNVCRGVCHSIHRGGRVPTSPSPKTSPDVTPAKFLDHVEFSNIVLNTCKQNFKSSVNITHFNIYLKQFDKESKL